MNKRVIGETKEKDLGMELESMGEMRMRIEGLKKERECVKIWSYIMGAHAKVEREWGMLKFGFVSHSKSNEVIPYKGFYVWVEKMKTCVCT